MQNLHNAHDGLTHSGFICFLRNRSIDCWNYIKRHQSAADPDLFFWRVNKENNQRWSIISTVQFAAWQSCTKPKNAFI